VDFTVTVEKSMQTAFGWSWLKINKKRLHLGLYNLQILTSSQCSFPEKLIVLLFFAKRSFFLENQENMLGIKISPSGGGGIREVRLLNVL
jgi:hypothetical protein